MRAIDKLLIADEPIPDIDFPWPDCPICDGPLINDDGWSCDTCEVYWERAGWHGEYQGEQPSPDAEGTPCPECGVPFGEERDELAPACRYCS